MSRKDTSKNNMQKGESPCILITRKKNYNCILKIMKVVIIFLFIQKHVIMNNYKYIENKKTLRTHYPDLTHLNILPCLLKDFFFINKENKITLNLSSCLCPSVNTSNSINLCVPLEWPYLADAPECVFWVRESRSDQPRDSFLIYEEHLSPLPVLWNTDHTGGWGPKFWVA